MTPLCAASFRRSTAPTRSPTHPAPVERTLELLAIKAVRTRRIVGRFRCSGGDDMVGFWEATIVITLGATLVLLLTAVLTLVLAEILIDLAEGRDLGHER